MTNTTNTTNLFNAMNNMTEANEDTVIVRTPMTKEEVETLKAKLKEEYRNNVYPNQFDSGKPYRVAIRYAGNVTNHGNFKNLEAAAMVGTIVAMARFGKKALKGHFDVDAAQDSSELKEWMQDERNQEIIAQAEKSWG